MIIERKMEIPEWGHYDILVAGGGVAGVAAAVNAARLGARVLLIEKSMKLGGLGTLGLINYFVPMDNGHGKQIIKGMADEFLKLSLRYGYGDIPEDYVDGQIPKERLQAYSEAGALPPRLVAPYSAEIFALQLTELCVEEGISLMFDTILTDPVIDPADPHRILGVLVENKSGTGYLSASYYIDTTGDADLLNRLKVPCTIRENYHIYSGVEVSLDSCQEALTHQDIAYARRAASGGTVNLYGDHQPPTIQTYNGTDHRDVNRYLISNQLEMLNKYKHPEDRKKRDIVTLPGMAQFRTTRRINGDYVLQESDTYRHFEDSIGAMNDFDRRDYLYEIPYRTLQNHEFPNIITAGRSAAGDGYAWDCLRVIPPAIITGQAAGAACVLALRENCALADIDIAALQQILISQNVIIHFDDADVPTE